MLLQRALTIRENSLGRTHVELVDLLKSLAALYQDNGDCLDAQSCLERALAIQESELGRDHADLALTLNDLGFVLEYAGDYEASQTAYERSLAITVRVHGEHSAEVAACCNSLAIVMENQHDIAGAKALHERSLSIRLQVLSPDHLHVAESQYNLAKLWQAEALSSNAAFYDEDQRQQALATARALHEQALATYHAKLGVRRARLVSLWPVFCVLPVVPSPRVCRMCALCVGSSACSFGRGHDFGQPGPHCGGMRGRRGGGRGPGF